MKPSRRTQRWNRTRQPTPQANSPRPSHCLHLRVHIARLAPANTTSNHRPGQHNYPSQLLRHLQQWLLDYYSTRTFNTCEHQPLPLMNGVPMRLMVNPTVEPVVHHTPVPVPLRWQPSVKKGLYQDIMLGILEPIPVGEPMTWCHRMVVCK